MTPLVERPYFIIQGRLFIKNILVMGYLYLFVRIFYVFFQYGRDWIQDKTRELFPNDYAAMLQSILNFLHSSQNNEEIQNEMFDLIGFDKIDFIEDLLVHRQELLANLKLKTEPEKDSK